ncbi:MAG: phospholipid-binding protein MlaC [Desulfohalobiaceae bacterium]
MRQAIIGLMLLLLVALPGQVGAQEAESEEAADLVREYMDQAVELIQDEDEPDPDQLASSLREMAEEIFDFELMSRMSLGRHWHSFDQEQKEEFVQQFTTLLEENYLGRMDEHMQEVQDFSREDMQVTGHTLLSSKRAEVESKISYQDQEIPVNYRLAYDGTDWKVYDVYVEGVSLIQNYRSQFDKLLQRGSAQDLLQKIEKKLQEGDPEDLEDIT